MKKETSVLYFCAITLGIITAFDHFFIMLFLAALLAAFFYQDDKKFLTGILFFSIGCLSINLRHNYKEFRDIDEPVKNIELFGTVEAVNFKNGGLRVRLNALECADCEASLPEKIILTLKNEEKITIGDRVKASGKLIGLPKKVYPFYYDSEAKYRLNKIGGFLIGNKAEITAESRGIVSILNFARNRVLGTFEKLNSNDVKGISLALFMGEKGKINEGLYGAVKNAGAAHILAISGLHMSIISLLVFGVLWHIFALIPVFALHFQTKKVAAALGCIFGFCFVVLASAPISAIRSYIMIMMFFMGIICDRETDSMRNLAIAGILILALWPEELFYPSFQLSFSSVLCLIKMPNFSSRSLLKRGLFYIGITAFSSTIISIVTAPFAVHHFTYIHLYGFLTNILVLPILGFFTMPFGLFAILSGLDTPLLIYEKSVEVIIILCRTIAGFPYSSIFANYVFSWQLGLYAAGIVLALCLKNWLKIAGIMLIALSVISMFFNAKPDFITDKENLVFEAGGSYYAPFSINNKFTAKVWEEKLGSPILPAYSSRHRCADGLCIGGNSISIISDSGFLHLKKLCENESLDTSKTLINMLDNEVEICIKNKCCNFKRYVTRRNLESHGAHVGFGEKIFYSYEGS